MRRPRVWLLLLLLLLLALAGPSAQVSETGLLTASDEEAAQGYFAIGQKTSLCVKPGSEFSVWLTAHRDVRVTVTVYAR